MSHHNKSWPTAKLLTRPSKSVSKALPQLPHPTLRQTSRCKKKHGNSWSMFRPSGRCYLQRSEIFSTYAAIYRTSDIIWQNILEREDGRQYKYNIYIYIYVYMYIYVYIYVIIIYACVCVCLCLCLHDLYIIMSVCLLLLSRFKAPRTKVSRGLRLQYAHPGVELLSLVSACWPQWQKRSMLRAPSVKTLRARTAYHSDHSVVSQPFNLRALLGANRNHDLTGHNVS